MAAAPSVELRVWLRLLACTNLLETRVRQRLQREFGTTLPRFDVLAQLYRESPISMSELSRRTMVTNGNVTGLVARLAAEGLIERRPGRDRRVQMVALTADGRRKFEEQARKHRGWIGEMMNGLTQTDARELLALLDHLKESIVTSDQQRLEAAE